MIRRARIGWAHRQWPRVDGTRDGLTVAIDGAVHPTNVDYSTAFIAVPTAPWTGNLSVTREGIVAKFATLLGAQDLVLGDEAFDRAFVVKATGAPAVREVLGADARREMLDLGVERLVYDDGREDGHNAMLVLEIDGVVETFEKLDRALQLVTKIASRRAGDASVR